jgi:hypothetical protein
VPVVAVAVAAVTLAVLVNLVKLVPAVVLVALTLSGIFPLSTKGSLRALILQKESASARTTSAFHAVKQVIELDHLVAPSTWTEGASPSLTCRVR